MHISGYIENGRFIPDRPMTFEGRTKAVLTVADHAASDVEENRRAWERFFDAIEKSDEELPGMPERFRLRRAPEEIDRL